MQTRSDSWMNENLRSRFRRRRETQKIPEDEEQHTDKLRQRRRKVDERAAEHAAQRRSDKAKEVVDPRRCAATARGNSLREKRGQHRLVQGVAEEESSAANVKKKIIAGAEEINGVASGRRYQPDE